MNIRSIYPLILGLALAFAFTPSAFAGGKSSGVSHSEIVVTKHVDTSSTKLMDAKKGSSPNLFKNATTGSHYKKVVLTN